MRPRLGVVRAKNRHAAAAGARRPRRARSSDRERTVESSASRPYRFASEGSLRCSGGAEKGAASGTAARGPPQARSGSHARASRKHETLRRLSRAAEQGADLRQRREPAGNTTHSIGPRRGCRKRKHWRAPIRCTVRSRGVATRRLLQVSQAENAARPAGRAAVDPASFAALRPGQGSRPLGLDAGSRVGATSGGAARFGRLPPRCPQDVPQASQRAKKWRGRCRRLRRLTSLRRPGTNAVVSRVWRAGAYAARRNRSGGRNRPEAQPASDGVDPRAAPPEERVIITALRLDPQCDCHRQRGPEPMIRSALGRRASGAAAPSRGLRARVRSPDWAGLSTLFAHRSRPTAAKNAFAPRAPSHRLFVDSSGWREPSHGSDGVSYGCTAGEWIDNALILCRYGVNSRICQTNNVLSPDQQTSTRPNVANAM